MVKLLVLTVPPPGLNAIGADKPKLPVCLERAAIEGYRRAVFAQAGDGTGLKRAPQYRHAAGEAGIVPRKNERAAAQDHEPHGRR